MKKYFLFGGIVLLFGIVINYSLGGFKPIDGQLISTKQTSLYGHFYEGSHSSDSLVNQVDFLRKLLDENNIDGRLTIVNYIQPGLEKRGMVKQFIGIETTSFVLRKKFSLDTLIIKAYNGIQFRIPIKPLVMPSPEKLKKIATQAAIDMNSELAGFSIEFYADNLLITNYPFK